MAYKYKSEEDKSIVPLIGLLVVLIIVVGGALFLLLSSPSQEQDNPLILPNVSVPDNETLVIDVNTSEPACEDDCHYEKAIISEQYDECKKIENSTLKENCFEQLSDVSLPSCLEVDDAEKKSFCITGFAVANKDLDLCDLVEVGRIDCIKQIDSCYGEDNEELCRALLNNNPDLCEYDTDCLMNYSLSNADSESCSLIQNEVVSKGCESAVKKSDKCYELDLKSERDYCYQIYALNTNDYKTCTSITPGTPYHLNCLSMFAASSMDYTICDAGNLQLDDKWACYTNYSLLSGDTSGCYAIHELASTNRFKCAFEFAKKYGDPSACQVIQSLPSRDTCYQGSIIYSNENLDADACKNITDFVWRNKCYNQAAIKSDDVSICEKIDEGFARKACMDAYKLAN